MILSKVRTVSKDINENYLEVIKTYLWANNIELIVGEKTTCNDLCAQVYQTPNKFGEMVEMPTKIDKELIISIVKTNE